MRLPVRIWKDGKFWIVEAACLDATTQGRSRKEALAMLEDWVRSSLDSKDYVVNVEHVSGNDAVMSVEDPKPLIGLMLQRTRALSGLTYAAVANGLHAKSRNAFRQYETGQHDPGLSKLCELVGVLGFQLEINLVPYKKAMALKGKLDFAIDLEVSRERSSR